MQIIDRVEVKSIAKLKALDESLGLAKIAVAYVLLTNGISNVLHYFVTSPISGVMNTFLKLTNQITKEALDAGTAAADLSPAYAAAGRMLREIANEPRQQVIVFGFLVLYLYQLVMSFGLQASCLRVNRGEELTWESLFDHLWMAGRIIFLSLMTALLTYAGVFFFVIPGLMAYFGFRFAPLLMVDHPEWSALRCMSESWKLTAGYKMQLLSLELSFIVWNIICYLALDMGYDIGYLFHPLIAEVMSVLVYMIPAAMYLPYKNLALSEYYESISKEKNK